MCNGHLEMSYLNNPETVSPYVSWECPSPSTTYMMPVRRLQLRAILRCVKVSVLVSVNRQNLAITEIASLTNTEIRRHSNSRDLDD
jgi:hypothetical protein